MEGQAQVDGPSRRKSQFRQRRVDFIEFALIMSALGVETSKTGARLLEIAAARANEGQACRPKKTPR